MPWYSAKKLQIMHISTIIWPAVQTLQHRTIRSSTQAQDKEAVWTSSWLCGAEPSAQRPDKNTECPLCNPDTPQFCRRWRPTPLFPRCCDGTSNHSRCTLDSRTCRCFRTETRPTLGWCPCRPLQRTGCGRTTPPPSNIALIHPPRTAPARTWWTCPGERRTGWAKASSWASCLPGWGTGSLWSHPEWGDGNLPGKQSDDKTMIQITNGDDYWGSPVNFLQRKKSSLLWGSGSSEKST